MAKYYGDIPCVKQNGIIHITKCATECLCGQKWSYSRPSNREDFKTENIIWRNLNAVTCEKCKELGVKKGKRIKSKNAINLQKLPIFHGDSSWNHPDSSRNYFSC